jgi:hypothetical protein
MSLRDVDHRELNEDPRSVVRCADASEPNEQAAISRLPLAFMSTAMEILSPTFDGCTWLNLNTHDNAVNDIRKLQS